FADGAIDVAPYRKGQETACDWCEFHSICRFDPWVESFRPLQPAPKAAAKVKAPKIRHTDRVSETRTRQHACRAALAHRDIGLRCNRRRHLRAGVRAHVVGR